MIDNSIQGHWEVVLCMLFLKVKTNCLFIQSFTHSVFNPFDKDGLISVMFGFKQTSVDRRHVVSALTTMTAQQ